jgi:hypothetical protein
MACMSRAVCYMTWMPRGDSGRIVIEIEPEMKRRLYVALAISGSTLKDWFIKNAAHFCAESAQPSLFSSWNNLSRDGESERSRPE